VTSGLWGVVAIEAAILFGSRIDAWRSSEPWAWRWFLWHGAIVVAAVAVLRALLDAAGRECARRAIEDWHSRPDVEAVAIAGGDEGSAVRTVEGWRAWEARCCSWWRSACYWASSGAGTSRRSRFYRVGPPERPGVAVARSLPASSRLSLERSSRS
jgi:hypothetical protein